VTKLPKALHTMLATSSLLVRVARCPGIRPTVANRLRLQSGGNKRSRHQGHNDGRRGRIPSPPPHTHTPFHCSTRCKQLHRTRKQTYLPASQTQTQANSKRLT
jgi:hypothetical protein